MMKRTSIFLVAGLLLAPIVTLAQGGIGNMPRKDIVMLRQSVRDSLSQVAFETIMQLKHDADANLVDSAALLIAYNGVPTKDGRWARPVNLNVPEEKAHVQSVLDAIKKLFAEYPDQVKEYYAVFKDKENPAGQRHVFQIHFEKGTTKRMVNWTFFPINDTLMLGEFN